MRSAYQPQVPKRGKCQKCSKERLLVGDLVIDGYATVLTEPQPIVYLTVKVGFCRACFAVLTASKPHVILSSRGYEKRLTVLQAAAAVRKLRRDIERMRVEDES